MLILGSLNRVNDIQWVNFIIIDSKYLLFYHSDCIPTIHMFLNIILFFINIINAYIMCFVLKNNKRMTSVWRSLKNESNNLDYFMNKYIMIFNYIL